MRKFCVFIAILFLTIPILAQTHIISGYITDKNTGEPLIGATALDLISKKGAVSNEHGFYSLTVKTDSVSLEYSYVTYNTTTINQKLSGDITYNIALEESNILEEAVFVARRNEIGVRGTQMSAIEVPIEQIKAIPAIAGEVDIIKAIQLLPGVQSGSEASTGLYVRGGGPDQNLILLDGVPLYNINHLFGFFSVFNADAIKNVTLYKGDFPARFGSRLSGVLDIRQNEGNENKFSGTASIGLLSSKINLEGPLFSNKTTFNISARRTYFDLIAKPIIALAQFKEDSKVTGGYHFYDLNAKITHTFSPEDKISASFYMGDDTIGMGVKEKNKKENYSSKMTFGWDWGNLLGAVNWAHQFSNTIYSNLNASYTRYRYNVKLGSNIEDKDEKTNIAIKYKSNIQDLSLSYDIDYLPNPAHSIKFGVNYIHHIFIPEVSSIDINLPVVEGDLSQTSGGNIINSNEVALYGEDNWTINNIFKLNLSFRASAYIIGDKTYPSFEPRISFRTLISDDLSFKAAYSKMSQYVHLLSSSNLILPTDLWVPVTDKIKPMKSDQYSAGFFYNLLDVVDLSVESYYKSMNNVLEYRDGTSFFASSEGWEEKVCMGEGWSYGVELLAQKNTGKLTGWIGYTWSKSERLFDREGMEINYGKPFYAKYDRRHDLSVVAQYKFTKKFDIASSFIFGTGTRSTLPSQEYEVDGYTVEHISSRNNYRLPNYARLDIGVNFHRQFKMRENISSTWNISIYNVLNRNNPFMVYDGYDSLKQLSIFPILPSVSYTLHF